MLLDFSDHRRAVYAELWRFFTSEGVLGVLGTDDRGEGSIVFTESTGEWDSSRPLPPPVISVEPEDYDELTRLAERHVPAKVRLDAEIVASDANVEAQNVVAEIPGKHKRDEASVVVGAHLRFMARGYRGHRQRRRLGGDAGGDAHPREPQAAHGSNGATGAVEWGRGGAARLAGLCVKAHFGDPLTMAGFVPSTPRSRCT